jgi:hypothetical protein
MTDWGKSFIGSEVNFALMFERFETLGSLAYVDENIENDLEKIASNPDRNVMARMPMGRAGWNTSSASILISELENETFRKNLLDAGFAKKSRRFLELFVDSFKRQCGRMSRW